MGEQSTLMYAIEQLIEFEKKCISIEHEILLTLFMALALLLISFPLLFIFTPLFTCEYFVFAQIEKSGFRLL